MGFESKVDTHILSVWSSTQASRSLIAAHSRFKLSCPGVLFKRYPPFASSMARHKRDIEFPSRFHFTAALHNHLDAHALGCFIAVINYSDFKGAGEFVRADHPTLILLGTVVTYAIALTSSALILWFFGRFDDVTMFTALAQTVALGLAATLGASAGRLLLQ